MEANWRTVGVEGEGQGRGREEGRKERSGGGVEDREGGGEWGR